MKTLRIGIASDQEIRKRMLDIASGRIKPSSRDPRVWVRSIDELKILLSDKNVNLLVAIKQKHPKSISDLAVSIGEDQGNLTRRLNMLAALGMVQLKKGEHHKGKAALVPKVLFDRIIPPTIDLTHA